MKLIIKLNVKALEIIFTREEMECLNNEFKEGAIKGDRYPPAFLAWAAS